MGVKLLLTLIFRVFLSLTVVLNKDIREYFMKSLVGHSLYLSAYHIDASRTLPSIV